MEIKVSRLFLSIAICFLTFSYLNSHADESGLPPAPEAYSATFVRGADHACKQSQRATRRFANMLQADCVASDISAGMDQSEIAGHCYGPSHRSAFVKLAEATCGKLKI